MITLTGEEAVNQAYYAEANDGLVMNSDISFRLDGKTDALSPQTALKMVKDGMIPPEALACEVLSVWDLLQRSVFHDSLFIHRTPDIVLVLSQEYGAKIGQDLRGFVISTSAYENAVRWAMNSPAIDRDFDRDEFIVRLHPRMLLGIGFWKQDVELLRHALEIADALIEIFGLDIGAIWNAIQEPDAFQVDGQRIVHGGHLLDIILSEVRKTAKRVPP